MAGKYLNTSDPEQPQPNGMKSRVVAQFVDAMPTPASVRHLDGHRTEWASQDGFYEALELAAANPNRAMLLVKYDIDGASMSKRKSRAKARVVSLEKLGYGANSGWHVRAVDDEVYVMYVGLL